MCIKKIPERGNKDIQDYWEELKIEIRKACKGWEANLRGEMRKKKEGLQQKIKELDRKADMDSLIEEEWKERYKLEEALEEIMLMKNSYRKREVGNNGY